MIDLYRFIMFQRFWWEIFNKIGWNALIYWSMNGCSGSGGGGGSSYVKSTITLPIETHRRYADFAYFKYPVKVKNNNKTKQPRIINYRKNKKTNVEKNSNWKKNALMFDTILGQMLLKMCALAFIEECIAPTHNEPWNIVFVRSLTSSIECNHCVTYICINSYSFCSFTCTHIHTHYTEHTVLHPKHAFHFNWILLPLHVVL